MMSVKADLYLYHWCVVDGAKAWLSCQAITWISVLAGLLWVFANPVTYYDIYVHVLHSM